MTAWFLISDPARGAHLYLLGILAALTAGYLEFTSQVEKRRRLLSAKSSTMNMNSVWMLPAAIMLPPGMAACFIAFVCVHTWIRVGRPSDQPTYRAVYSASAYVLPALAISVALGRARLPADGLPDGIALLGAIAVGIVIFRIGNAALVSVAVRLTSPSAGRSALFGSRFDNGLEFATLVLGGITAICLAREPWLAVLVLPAVFLLQHHALIRELVEAATTDVKTELLNAASWRQLAEQELATARRRRSSAAVFVIDMDYFKRINDEYGHLGGDAALRAVGEALADEFRRHDAVGRFGGEEFVALVPGVDVGDGIRRRRAGPTAYRVPSNHQRCHLFGQTADGNRVDRCRGHRHARRHARRAAARRRPALCMSRRMPVVTPCVSRAPAAAATKATDAA